MRINSKNNCQAIYKIKKIKKFLNKNRVKIIFFIKLKLYLKNESEILDLLPLILKCFVVFKKIIHKFVKKLYFILLKIKFE
jgi:hypothetical protein